MPRLVAKAANTAFAAHHGQYRDDKSTPFYKHLAQVTGFMVDFGISRGDWLAAAYLHDIVEDTEWTIDQVTNEFGHSVGSLVAEVTDPDGLRGRAAKDRQVRHAAEGKYSLPATLIKIADKRANVLDTLNASWKREKKLEYTCSAAQVARLASSHFPDHDMVVNGIQAMLADAKTVLDALDGGERERSFLTCSYADLSAARA